MLKKIITAIDNLRGIGKASVAIPLFDGALKTNSVLDEARTLCHMDDTTDIAVAANGEIYISAGNRLIKADVEGQLAVVESFEKPIQAIAAARGWIAVALEDAVVMLSEASGERTLLERHEGAPLMCLTALSFGQHRDCLYLAQGSSRWSAGDWKRDLMTYGASGRVVRWDFGSNQSETIASGLRWCSGVLATSTDDLIIAESWAHCLQLMTKATGDPTVVYADLPGYPARVSSAADGGYWLSLFARRTQLIEFVLREPEYCNRMLASIPEPYWIAPALRSGEDFLEPLQFGAVRQMGTLKPWAPSNSYGIVIKLDAHFVPQYSYHSRAGGRNHGTVSAVESGGRLHVVSRGSGKVLVAPV